MSKYKAKHHTTADMYEYFLKKYPDTEVTYPMFRHVISQFNKKAMDNILDGKTLKMGFGLGYIRIQKLPRNFNKPSIDWGETNKLREKGIKKRVFFTDDYLYKFYWAKKACNIRNKTVYRFDPTRGPNGNKQRLANKIKNDEFATLNYKF